MLSGRYRTGIFLLFFCQILALRTYCNSSACMQASGRDSPNCMTAAVNFILFQNKFQATNDVPQWKARRLATVENF